MPSPSGHQCSLTCLRLAPVLHAQRTPAPIAESPSAAPRCLAHPGPVCNSTAWCDMARSVAWAAESPSQGSRARTLKRRRVHRVQGAGNKLLGTSAPTATSKSSQELMERSANFAADNPLRNIHDLAHRHGAARNRQFVSNPTPRDGLFFPTRVNVCRAGAANATRIASSSFSTIRSSTFAWRLDMVTAGARSSKGTEVCCAGACGGPLMRSSVVHGGSRLFAAGMPCSLGPAVVC